MKRFAFTLAELLIALTIVGVVAVLTVPSVTKNIYTKSNIVKLEATVKLLNDAINNMMINERINDVADGSLFYDSDEFIGKYLKITSDCHNAAEDSYDADCIIDASTIETAQNNGGEQMGRLCGHGNNTTNFLVKLANGAKLRFCDSGFLSSNVSGYMLIDVNGGDPPNIFGRDVFEVEVLDNGTVGQGNYLETHDLDADDILNACLTDRNYAGFYCYYLLEHNNWEMNY